MVDIEKDIKRFAWTLNALFEEYRGCTKKCFIAEKKKDAAYIAISNSHKSLFSLLQNSPHIPTMDGLLVHSFVGGMPVSRISTSDGFHAEHPHLEMPPAAGDDDTDASFGDNFTTLKPSAGTIWGMKSVRKALEDVITKEFNQESSRRLLAASHSAADFHADGNCFASR